MKQKGLLAICLALWAAIPVPLVIRASGQAPIIGDVVKVADIAREKDVVWLSLVIAGMAIGFSAWLVYRRDKLIEAQTAALLESAKATANVAASLSALRDELNDQRLDLRSGK